MSHHDFHTRANEPLNTIQFATTPRHLAGHGDPRHITQALRAAGWKNHSVPDYPHILLASPDHHYHLTLEPEPDTYKAAWRITSHTPGQYWYVEFGGETPVEVLAGFTDALIVPVPGQEPVVWQPLVAAGWAYEMDERGSEVAVAPDGIMSVSRFTTPPIDAFYWKAEAAEPTGGGGHKRIWHAYFGDATPRHLIAGFTAALASPEPVQRRRYDVPRSHLVTQEQEGPQGEQLVAEHEARLRAARASARKTRRMAALQTQPSPAAGVPAEAAVHRR
ncbi:DUF317 domain-containing protein [Streptomyces scopuliridis]|uniref:DUF317 domain-containing protein n=1 Tax=Streptomyces scopuliridis TaxID=452529 RepID=A0ACD4ZTN6_9ACTN|nr:DUF317 domain-containing protein [Streptomyces scopuliridis]WSC01549.1 DUF317 domain-containing protein [Streptomyces scopuliridis]WSC04913.1 DUF317 domain-containing protein [Streptomyces scopuliridis]